MSRIGKKPILIPENVEVKIEDQNVTIKGPKGKLSRMVRPEIKVELKENKIFIEPKIGVKSKKDKSSAGQTGSARGKKTNAFWGLTRVLLSNMIGGVTRGYEKKLQIEGIGYRANLEGNDLVLFVGFSHPIKIAAPSEIKFSVEKNIITVSGIDKELVGQLAAKIRKVQPPEPYKGKGIRYLGETVRKKVGKKAVATAG